MSQHLSNCLFTGWLVLGGLGASPAWAQVLEEHRQPQTGLIEQLQRQPTIVPETPPAEPPASASKEGAAPSPPEPEIIPPERIYSPGRRAEPRLWEMLNQGQYQALEAEVKRLRQEDPNWTPPAELLHWLNHHLKLMAAERAAEAGVDRPRVERRETRHRPDPQLRAYEQAAAEADRLHRQGQSEQALKRLAPWGQRIYKMRDAGRLELLAWIRLSLGQSEQALADFRQVLTWRAGQEAARGELLALQRLGRAEELADLAVERVRRWPALKRTAIDSLRALAAKGYESGDYAAAERLLEQAMALGADDPDTRRLAAWNRFKQGQWRQAAERFQALYREKGDEESARGLILSLRALNAASELSALAETDRGPLRRLWREEEARAAYASKQFSRAWQIAPEAVPELAGLDSPSLWGGAGMRWRSGDPGTSRLREFSLPLLAYEQRAGPLRIQISGERVKLEAGDLKAGTPIGSAPADPNLTSRLAPTTQLRDGLRPALSLRLEDRLTWGLLVDATPEGELSPRLDGALSLAQSRPDGAWSLRLEQRPVRESILSYTGLRDPYTGKTWGQVSKRGVSAEGWQALNARLSLSGSLQLHEYQGQAVADNRGVSGRIGLGYGFQSPGFTYLNLGPFVDYRHFEDNLSHFTYGHGGYYSPQHDLGVGLALDFQTREGQSWLLKGSAYAGWRKQEQDPSPWFPLADDGRRYTGDENSGLSAGLALQGAWLLSPHWQLSASAFFDHSPDFDQGAAMLLVRYQFAPRKALFSDDLKAGLRFD